MFLEEYTHKNNKNLDIFHLILGHNTSHLDQATLWPHPYREISLVGLGNPRFHRMSPVFLKDHIEDQLAPQPLFYRLYALQNDVRTGR